MPPIAIAAGIGAVGALGGAVLQNRGQGKAIDAQTKANNQAMAYQREQDQKREVAMQAWQANREALLRRYGVDIAQSQGPAQAAPAAPVSAMGRSPMVSRQSPMGANVGELMQRPPQGAWNDWEALGLRRG